MDIHAVGRRMTAWSIAGLLVTVPLVYTSDIFDYALLPKRLALFVWSALAFAGWSVTASSGRASISSGFPLYAVSAYTGLVVLSMINVSNMTVGSEELLFQLGLVGLFLVGAVARRSDTELWCWILIGVGGLVSLVGILQYFGFAPSLSIPSNGPPSAFFGYRNFAAMFLIGVIPVAAVMAIRAPGMWASALAVLSAVLSMLFLLYTRSRGAWLGIAVGTVMTTGLAALLPQTRFLISNAWRDGSRAKLGLAAAAIVLLAFAAPLPARFTDTGLQRFDEKKSDLITTVASITWDTGDRGRKTMWERSLPLILDHKWTGVGPGHWEFVYPKYDRGHMLQPNSSPKRPHNDYIWIAAENGLPALLAFLFFLAAVGIAGYRSLRESDDRDNLILLGMLAAGLAISVHALFSFPKEQPQAISLLYLFAGIIVGRRPAARVRIPAAAVAACLVAVSVTGAYLTWRHIRFDGYFLSAMHEEDGEKWATMKQEILAGLDYGAFRPHAWVILGRAHEKLGEIDDAGAAYSQALELAPYSWHAHNGVGVIHKRRGDRLTNEEMKRKEYDSAMVAYNKAIRIFPASTSLRTNVGALFRAMGNEDLAESEYRAVLRTSPGDAGANNNLGNIFKARGQLDSAEVYFRRALETNPDLAQANQNLGDLLSSQGRYARASRYYLKALEIRPDRPEIYWSLGSAYEAVAELTLAEQSYRDAIRMDPSFPRSYFSLGTMLFGLHRWEETIELFQTFLSIWEGDPRFTTFAEGRIKSSRKRLKRMDKK